MSSFAETAYSPEQIDEQALFSERLTVVEQELAASSPEQAPIHFLAGEEVELKIDDYPGWQKIAERVDKPGFAVAARQEGLLLPNTPIAQLSEAEKQSKIEDVKAQAHATVGMLEPRTPVEAERQRVWLDQIDEFTLSDAINFQLYAEFSQPTLGDTAVPWNATYNQIEHYGAERGWIEFRFGPGKLQSGYYDNSGISELRFTPCPPTELSRREHIVLQRLADIAAEYGVFGVIGSRHLNMSAYQEDAQGVLRPILGAGKERRAHMLDAAAGLTEAIEDGAWLHESSTQQPLNFYEVATERFRISSRIRESIRIMHDDVELREEKVMASTEHGLLWMMAAIARGLEKGWGSIAAEGYQVPLPTEGLRVIRTPDYDKQQHLHILRALQNSTVNPDGTFRLDEDYNRDRTSRITTAFLGSDILMATDKVQNYAFNTMAISALRLDKEGFLHCTPESLQEAYQQLGPSRAMRRLVQPLIGGVIGKIVAQRINDRVQVVRLRNQQFIEGKPYYQGLAPMECEGRLAQSAIFHRMYGAKAETYSHQLMDKAQQVYEGTEVGSLLHAEIAKALSGRAYIIRLGAMSSVRGSAVGWLSVAL